MEIIRRLFRSYYSKMEIDIDEIYSREFGFGWEKKIEERHHSFPNTFELRKFLIERIPMFISYSLAYYKYPHLTPMERKEWLKAELAFDYDIDVEGLVPEEKLLLAREKMVYLVEEFLTKDFGIDKKKIKIVFSGNKGYHIRVKDEEFMQLQAEERRKIANYVRGEFSFLHFFQERNGKFTGPGKNEKSNRKRAYLAVKKWCEEECKGLKRERLLKKIEGGDYSQLRGEIYRAEKYFKEFFVEIDSAVTFDITRLLRMENSLHGETGLIVKEVKNEKFSPYRDAIAFKGKAKIEALENIPSFEFSNTTQEKIKKNEKKIVDLSYAVYLTLKGKAKILSFA